jgi:hypothetical protein
MGGGATGTKWQDVIFLNARLDRGPLLLLPSEVDEKELIQPSISYFDYHDLCLKSTTAVKLLDLTLTGSRHYTITIKAHLHHFGYYGNKG